MFVLVGGHHQFTYEPTDKVFTSTTTEVWRHSLPPMPTKRYQASSVSTRSSPEALVVAGGRGLYGKELDVVEVLLENKWTTVDPLPSHEFEMRSTLHDGNLHFMGGVFQDSAVFTCSCSSLISSVKKSITSTSPLWRQYQAPGDRTTAVSYCSRLVNIDGQGTVKGYSNTTRSWEAVTSTGDTHLRYSRTIAATVLTTEFLYCNDSGVYRVMMSGKMVMFAVS